MDVHLLLLLKIPFSRVDSSLATGKDGENAEVEKKRREESPNPCPASPLSCRRQNFLSGPRCIGQLWRVPQIKITSWEDSDANGRWVWVGGCRKRIEGWVASHLMVSFASCSSPTQEQVFCLLMRIVVEILSESLLWSPGRKAVMGRSTSFGGVLVRCQM